MRHFLLQADLVLRAPERLTAAGRPRLRLGHFVGLVLACGVLYGGAMGTFGLDMGPRLWQVVFAAVKVPFLLLATFFLCLPSFFILNTLLGVRADFGRVVRALFGGQAGLTLILASLAPYTLLWYASFTSYPNAVLFNGVMFAVASFAAQGLLRRAYRPLIAERQQHRWLLWIWLVLYVFTGTQMAWILRPFIGYPEMPVQFFRADAWGNAYVVILRMVWDMVAR